MYKIGYPLWTQAAKLGIPLKLRVDVMRDDEADVFIATSKGLRGLVCEAKTIDELVKEVHTAANELISMKLHSELPIRHVTDMRYCAA